MEKIKEWLRRGWRIERRINNLMEEKDWMFEIATSTTSRPSDVNVQQGGGNSTEARMLRYAEYSNLLDNMIDELVDTKCEIMKLIKKVEDARYQELLILRYIEFNSWNDISNKMGYEYRHVLRLHGKALLAAEKIRERLAL